MGNFMIPVGSTTGNFKLMFQSLRLLLQCEYNIKDKNASKLVSPSEGNMLLLAGHVNFARVFLTDAQ